MFTSIAIMQLIEKGKLNISDKISKYLDTTWLDSEIISKITIHQLLSHTSGLGDIFSEAFEKAPKTQFSKLEGFKPFVKSNKIAFEPGTNWSYSNTGMLLLGVIIEKVTGTDYFNYVQENIFKPTGMLSSNVYYLGNSPNNIAIGYLPIDKGRYQSNLNTGATRGSSAGGGYSNVNDLYKFALALRANQLVSSTSQEKMFTDYMGKNYGYGFQLWNTATEKVIGHTGGAEGISAVLYIFPNSGYTAVVLSNYDRGAHWLGEYLLYQISNLKD